MSRSPLFRVLLAAALALCLILPGEAIAKKKKKKRKQSTPTSQHGIGPGGVPALRDMLLGRIAELDMAVKAMDERILDLEDQVEELEGLSIDDDLDGYSENQGDCDDEVAEVNPGAAEDPINGVDDDCDGDIDEIDMTVDEGAGAS